MTTHLYHAAYDSEQKKLTPQNKERNKIKQQQQQQQQK